MFLHFSAKKVECAKHQWIHLVGDQPESENHRKPLRTAKATDPKELLMVLAPSVGSSKGHYQRI